MSLLFLRLESLFNSLQIVRIVTMSTSACYEQEPRKQAISGNSSGKGKAPSTSGIYPAELTGQVCQQGLPALDFKL